MKIVVLDGFAVNPGDLSWDFLKKYGEVSVHRSTAERDVVKNASGATALFTNRVKITREVISRLPELRFVSALGTGYDMIDVGACRERGIVVCNAPGYSSDSVAQHAFMLLMALATDLDGLRAIVSAGKWTGMPGFHYERVRMTELAGKTVGLIGYGGIGRRMAQMCRVFGMEVIAYSPSKNSGSDGIARFAPTDVMLPECDFVSLHCPLNYSTRGMVNRTFISKMKRGAAIINTSRGAVINEAQLAEALNSSYLSGAALDVLAHEPPEATNPLLTAKNCIITPHCAWTSIEARRRLIDILDRNLASFVSTGRGINEVF